MVSPLVAARAWISASASGTPISRGSPPAWGPWSRRRPEGRCASRPPIWRGLMASGWRSSRWPRCPADGGPTRAEKLPGQGRQLGGDDALPRRGQGLGHVQGRGRRARAALGPQEHSEHPPRRPLRLLEQLRLHPVPLDGVADRPHQRLGRDLALDQVVLRPLSDRLHRQVVVADAGQQDRRQVGGLGVDQVEGGPGPSCPGRVRSSSKMWKYWDWSIFKASATRPAWTTT